MWKLRSLITCLVATVGCGTAPISAKDVTGMWVISPASRVQLQKDYQGARGTLMLNQDGTFAATELPRDLLFREPERVAPPVSGSGTWKVTSYEHNFIVQLAFTKIGDEERRSPYGTELTVTRSGRQLYYYQGDPDQARTVTFERP
jgi:hypothetical protein